MKYVAAALLALLPIAAPAQDAKNPVEWLSDLATACERAEKEGKLILFRQVLCDCVDRSCAYAELAKRPLFLDDAGVRDIVNAKYIAVIEKRATVDDAKGLVDPGIGREMPKGAPIRTYFLTPRQEILHRLDLCAHAEDFESELEFVHLARLLCFDKTGAMEPEGKRILSEMHDEHLRQPKQWHKKRWGNAASECRCRLPQVGGSGSRQPWKGYNSSIPWHTDVQEAKALAKHAKRSVLYFQVVGDLYKEGC